jgi:3-dehydroquinate synthase
MLDAVGLGAALVHRGVRVVRFPTTVLAQNDAGIGVKNGVNACGQKNFFGCFQPPFAVVNDLDFLDTLADRDWRSGIAEAIKVAAIKDVEFFRFLETNAAKIAARDAAAMETLVRRCARLHVEHTATSGDPFEFGSARPLDFGHWSAHWIEMASGGTVSHGEAVAFGIAIDSLYADRRGWLRPGEGDRILACLRASGFALWHELLGRRDASGRLAVLDGLDRFREHLGGELAVTLPSPLGSRREVHELDAALVGECVERLREDA